MERVQKIIANSGFCSRRDAEELIRAKKVKVNGIVIKLGDKAEITDRIEVGRDRIALERKRYILFNKQQGLLSEIRDTQGRGTVIDVLRQKGVRERLIPVGKLEQREEGMILLTNDGDFANRIMHPRYEIKKTYRLKLDKRLSNTHAERIRNGVFVNGKKSYPANVRVSGKNVEITTHESKETMKAILNSLRYTVNSLVRVAIGPVTLSGVKPGQFRDLEQGEVDKILNVY